jgi:NAD-dependent deacetylase
MKGEELEYLADKAADLILSSKRIVVFTGAGVSTESGIPDFRSPGGIWSKFDPDEFTYQKFLSSPETRKKQWQMLKSFVGMEAGPEPNPAHYAIAELEKMGKLDCVITQNVDNLHQKAGVPEDKVFELHGNMRWVRCLSCGKRSPVEEIQRRLAEGIEIPDCDSCHGILKPDAVFFGESLPPQVLSEATQRSRNCALFITIGSTLVVYPAAYMPSYAVEAGAKLIIINLMPTPMDRHAAIFIQAKAGEVMPKIMERVRAKVAQVNPKKSCDFLDPED